MTPLGEDRALVDELKASGVHCEALSTYQQRPEPRRGIVLDISATTEPHIDALLAAVERLR